MLCYVKRLDFFTLHSSFGRLLLFIFPGGSSYRINHVISKKYSCSVLLLSSTISRIVFSRKRQYLVHCGAYHQRDEEWPVSFLLFCIYHRLYFDVLSVNYVTAWYSAHRSDHHSCLITKWLDILADMSSRDQCWQCPPSSITTQRSSVSDWRLERSI